MLLSLDRGVHRVNVYYFIIMIFSRIGRYDCWVQKRDGHCGEKKTVWTNRQDIAHAKWEGSRQSLTEAMLGQFYLDDVECSNCHMQQAFINCIHCRTSSPISGDCDKELHRKKPFHDRQFWQENLYQFLSPLQSVNAGGQLIDISKSHIQLIFPFKLMS